MLLFDPSGSGASGARQGNWSPNLRSVGVLDMLLRVASDAVWTALISGGAATLSGGVGWLTARQQAKIELAKLKQERDPGTSSDLKFRQELYLRYIHHVDIAFRSTGSETKAEEEWMNAMWAARAADDEMELFASNAVLPARAAVWDLLEELNSRVSIDKLREEDPERFPALARAAIDKGVDSLQSEFRAARGALITAIRQDVGPE